MAQENDGPSWKAKLGLLLWFLALLFTYVFLPEYMPGLFGG